MGSGATLLTAPATDVVGLSSRASDAEQILPRWLTLPAVRLLSLVAIYFAHMAGIPRGSPEGCRIPARALSSRTS